jgi:RNA recognition motif-containing protein
MHELSQEEISAQPEVEDEQLELAALSDNSDYARRGIVYISRIPPGLTPSSLRDIMQQFGQVTRIYCTPQGNSQIILNINTYILFLML